MTTVTPLPPAPAAPLVQMPAPAAVPQAQAEAPALAAPVPPKRGFFRTLWRAAQCVWGWVPLTWATAVAAPTLYWVALPYADAHKDRVVYTLTWCTLGLIGLAIACVLLGALWARIACRKSTQFSGDLTADVATPTNFTLGKLNWCPILDAKIAWEEPDSIEASVRGTFGGLREEVTPQGRCLEKNFVRKVTVQDIFGLSRFVFRVKGTGAVRVLPNPGRIGWLRLTEQMTGGDMMSHPEGTPDGDLIEMRRYAPGDPLKCVLWKLYKKTGKLMVRVAEKALSPTRRVMAYQISGKLDEASAGIARAILEGGQFGKDYLFSADGNPTPVSEVRECLEVLARSASFRAQGADGLDNFLRDGTKRGVKACYLFVPSTPGAWLDKTVAAVGAHRGPVSVFIGVDDLTTAPQRRLEGWGKFFFAHGKVKTQGSRAEVLTVAKRLEAAGMSVRIVERASGRAFSAPELQG